MYKQISPIRLPMVEGIEPLNSLLLRFLKLKQLNINSSRFLDKFLQTNELIL